MDLTGTQLSLNLVASRAGCYLHAGGSVHTSNSEGQDYVEGLRCANALWLPSIQNLGMGHSGNWAFVGKTGMTPINRHLNSLLWGTLC